MAGSTRKRRTLVTGAVVFAVFMLYPIATAFTPLLDGNVGGVGIAYLAGFAEVLLALAVAIAHTRSARAPQEG